MIPSSTGRDTLVHAGVGDSVLDVRQLVEMELTPGEEILWADRRAPFRCLMKPRTSAFIAKAAMIVIIISLAAAMLGQAYDTAAWFVGACVMAATWGLIAAIAALATRSTDLKLPHCVLYAVTNQRILQIYLGHSRRVTSHRLALLGQSYQVDCLRRTENPDGSGSLTIPARPAGPPGSTPAPGVCIDVVPNVRAAERALLQALASAEGSPRLESVNRG